MSQVLALPEPMTPLFVRRGGRQRFSDEDYWAFCEANRDLHIERTAQGEIIVTPPAGGESDYRTTTVLTELGTWARRNGRGKVFGPSVQYFLPDGSGLSPDVSWVSNERLATLTKQQRKKFLRLTPEFVVEVISPTDRLRDAKLKMELWMANGVELGWLIDGDARTVHIYRPGQPMKTRRNLALIAGDGSVTGFVLELETIWQGL